MDADVAACPPLSAEDIAALDTAGTRRTIAAGDYLYRDGDITYDFHVLLSGAVEIVVGAGRDEQTVARHGPGRFLGELNLLTGQRVFVSARVTEPGEVIVVPALSALQLTGPDGDGLIPCLALFSFIGADPASEWLCGCARLDEHGFVLTDRAMDPEQLGAEWQVLGR